MDGQFLFYSTLQLFNGDKDTLFHAYKQWTVNNKQ